MLQRGADTRGEVKSIRYKPSPLGQGVLEIPSIEVTMKWQKTGDGDFAQEGRRSRAIPLEIMIVTLTNVKTFYI